MIAHALRTRVFTLATFVTVVLAATSACADSSPNGPGEKTRTYYMGFSNFPPAPDTMLLRRSVQMWTTRADAAILHLDVPWAALLAGAPADSLVHADVMPLVQSYINARLHYVIETDVTNGVDRTAEAPALVSLGRSITEDTVQKLYVAYVAALDSIAQPNFLGLASETNLIRAAAPGGVYAAVVRMTNAAAAAVQLIPRGAGFLYVSVQVEVAWGRLGGSNTFVGIDQDRADFPFITALGLSSYPYLGGFTDPSQVPDNYFSRLRGTPALYVLVTEGGWSSADIGTIHSSPAIQAAWIKRASVIAENANALAWFQLAFTDINLQAFGLPANDPQLVPFVRIGLVDTALAPKPALAEWDRVFALRIDQKIPCVTCLPARRVPPDNGAQHAEQP